MVRDLLAFSVDICISDNIGHSVVNVVDFGVVNTPTTIESVLAYLGERGVDI